MLKLTSRIKDKRKFVLYHPFYEQVTLRVARKAPETDSGVVEHPFTYKEARAAQEKGQRVCVLLTVFREGQVAKCHFKKRGKK